MSDVDRLKAEWESLRDEESRLAADAEQLTKELRTITDRLRELRTDWGSYGLVKQAHAAWKQAEAIENDRLLPRVIWAREPKYGETDLVLVKSTPKRIYVRRVGSTWNELYDRSTGMRVGRADHVFGGIIDVSKTLGEQQ